MRTTIELPDELMTRAKVRAAEEGITLKDLFVSAVWALCFLSDRVHWSGHEFRVLKDGQMVRVSAAVPEHALAPYRAPEERDQHPASI